MHNENEYDKNDYTITWSKESFERLLADVRKIMNEVEEEESEIILQHSKELSYRSEILQRYEDLLSMLELDLLPIDYRKICMKLQFMTIEHDITIHEHDMIIQKLKNKF